MLSLRAGFSMGILWCVLYMTDDTIKSKCTVLRKI
jgi:hypothetical protein